MAFHACVRRGSDAFAQIDELSHQSENCSSNCHQNISHSVVDSDVSGLNFSSTSSSSDEDTSRKRQAAVCSTNDFILDHTSAHSSSIGDAMTQDSSSTASRTNLLLLNNGPSSSKTSLVMEKKPKLQRFGEKLKNLIVHKSHQPSTQFRKIFAEALPPNEQLISSFTCTYDDAEHPSPIAGRLYISLSCIAFSANSAPVRFVISFDNVDSVEIKLANDDDPADSNGIRVLLDDGFVCTFGSFSSQDKAHATLMRLWKSSDTFTNRQQFPMDEFARNPMLKMSGTQTRSQILATDTESATTTEDAGRINEPANCECSEHHGQLMIDSTYQLSANQMFRFLFTENSLIKEFHASVKRTDISYCGWAESDEMSRGKRKHKRSTNYTVALSNNWGPKTSDVTEQQELIEVGKQPADGYVVKKNAVNAGVPYADSFNIFCTYCITKVSPTSCRMRVHAGLEFRKSIMGMIKGYIERSTISGMDEYYKKLDAYIRAHLDDILQSFDTQRVSAGTDFSSTHHGSFRSMTESNGGYESDVEDRREATKKKRLVKSTSYAPSRPSPVDQQHSFAEQRSLLTDISYSLRLIALILVLLLMTQLWSMFASNTVARDPLGNSAHVLGQLVRHSQHENTLDTIQKILSDIEQQLSTRQ